MSIGNFRRNSQCCSDGVQVGKGMCKLVCRTDQDADDTFFGVLQ